MMPSEEQATGTLEEIGQRDHSVTAEYRIFGAPGCGKTTNITRQVKRAVEKHGADAVLVTSYSRRGTGWPRPAYRFGPGRHAALALLPRARQTGDRGVMRRRVE